jgi:hypothetical protein
MGAVTAPRTDAVAWPGRLTGGAQGDKVHVRASSRGGLAAGHGNRAGNSLLGWRNGEGGGVGRGGAFPGGETLRRSSVPLCGSYSKVRRRGR